MPTNKEKNRALVEAFAATARASNPSIKTMTGALSVNATDAIDGMRVVDGYMAACFNNDCNIGITALAWHTQKFKVFAEIVIEPGHLQEFMLKIAGEELAQLMVEYVAAAESTEG